MQILIRLLLVLAACTATGVLAAGAVEKTWKLSIVRGAVAADQRVLTVGKGDAVRLTVTSDAPGEIHLHGYRLQAQLAPGRPAQLAFKAHATGRYPLEWHGAGAASSTRPHRGPPLATLEVRPR